MGPAIGAILPFAVGVAVSPIPIIGVILILFTPLARSNGPAFVAGWLLALLAVGGVTLLVADSGDVATHESASDLAYALKVVLGLTLLLLALQQWKKRPREGDEVETPGWMASIETFTPPRSFGMGALLGVNPKNLFLVIGAGLTIAQFNLEGAEQWIVLLVFTVLASVSVAGSVLYYILAGAKAKERLDPLKVWLLRNDAAVMAVLLLVFGVILFGQGFGGLTD